MGVAVSCDVVVVVGGVSAVRGWVGVSLLVVLVGVVDASGATSPHSWGSGRGVGEEFVEGGVYPNPELRESLTLIPECACTVCGVMFVC